jgi:hypothetical protein
LAAAEACRARRHPQNGTFPARHWTHEIPLLTAEMAGLRDKINALIELAHMILTQARSSLSFVKRMKPPAIFRD